MVWCIGFYSKLNSELQSVTCHVGSLSVTCYPTQVNAPHLNPNQIGRSLIYPTFPWSLCWFRWLVTNWDGLLACRQSPIQVLTWPGVEQLHWSNAVRYHCAISLQLYSLNHDLLSGYHMRC